LLPGNIEGGPTNEAKITKMISSILSDPNSGNNQTIFYVDES